MYVCEWENVNVYTLGNAGLMSKRNKYYALCDGVLCAGSAAGGCDNWLSMIFHAIILSHLMEKFFINVNDFVYGQRQSVIWVGICRKIE